MQRLTVAGRLILSAVIIAALYFGFKFLGGSALIDKFKKDNIESTSSSEESTATAGTNSGSEASASSEDPAKSGNGSSATSSQKTAFEYTPPAPVNGKLKGVVELGASGFNSFIVRIDEDKNWRLEKAEFNNSLVIENMATDEDIRAGLKKYIGGMLDFGVGGKDIHFVVSSGAQKADGTMKIVKVLKSINYFVNEVTAEKEGKLGLKSVLPKDYERNSFVADIGSGNTKISWKSGSGATAVESYGAKYFQNNVSDATVFTEVSAKAKQIPSDKRKTCFIIGGVPFEMAKKVRNGKERYTVLSAPSAYNLENAKSKAGLNIYNAIAEATGCEQFVFDWDSNFTIGFLLDLP